MLRNRSCELGNHFKVVLRIIVCLAIIIWIVDLHFLNDVTTTQEFEIELEITSEPEVLVPVGNPLPEETFHGIVVPNVTIRQEILNDSDVQLFLSKNKVYVSITTSPSRITGVRFILDTLDLTFVSKVFLNLPQVFGRTGETFLVPESLIEHYGDKLVILKVQDFGPITKILPTIEYLQSQGEHESFVISIDDDVRYVPSTVYEAVYFLVKNPNSAVSGSGHCLGLWNIHSGQWPVQPNCRDRVQVLEGFESISVQVKFYDVELLKLLSSKCLSKYCFISDDIVLSFNLALADVDACPFQNENFGGDNHFSQVWGFGNDALHKGGGSGEDSALKEALQRAGIRNHEFNYRTCHESLKGVGLNEDGKWKSIDKIKQNLLTRFQSLDEGSIKDSAVSAQKNCLETAKRSSIIQICHNVSDCFGIYSEKQTPKPE
jgi:hypothetical protein